MSVLTNRNILIGISGGIAAYKCAELVRRLKDHQTNVRVVMTSAAKSFITPLTMQAVSGNPVADDLLDPAAEAAMGHIELAKWADLIVVAPASADVLARINAGMANDLLTTLILATDAPIALVPAMNQQMYKAPATVHNLAQLQQKQFHIWGPAQGEQACGDIGPGRMLEPAEILEHIQQQITAQDEATQSPQLLANTTVTITAGPTREALDPVRYISNHSSGKMGVALAQACLDLGAQVNLIHGPIQLPLPVNANAIAIESAQQMHDEALIHAKQSDIFIACAAVADYRPVDIADQKIKKSTDEITLRMVKNPDIVAAVAGLTEHRPFTVGFAAETQDVEKYAKDKMKRKKLDMICANDVSIAGQGFNSDNNALNVFWQNEHCSLPCASKTSLAMSLMKVIKQQFDNQK
ncbi:bifunctional phosphopantothenoylcysteine decarboxylase/phosphopantothenate--cysteine ligase CoaBC [Flocculibacter collagenilyticus]|uniref:bifunctional phosphopantothenoylcysteine decarboxylase/phosphopantothenate--cysteine ligase CoaBC n=1 Tax=Flocculibacter collagenilyticus TaxID=2744479 RepID=UPI0018F7BB94|nr:bifunctional phosphopantothenoylcysteine decarboxylase/phosphopantothenate--cysteine ligase CoaBC [Flocculibacter collagenilyticus]